MVERITHTSAEQTSVFANLLDEMQKQGQLITPALPDGQAVAVQDQQDQGVDKTGHDKAKPTAAVAAPTPQISNSGSVTDSIMNQGQLIKSTPQISAGGVDDGISDIKKSLDFLQGAVGGNSASTGASSGGDSSGGGGGGGEILSTIADVALAVVGWIICTELVRQHRLPLRYYIVGGRVFAAYHPWVKEGYYLWAIPSVRHLRAHPRSWYSCFLNLVFNWRAENIAAYAGVPGARKLWRGAAVTAVLWPTCFALGACLWICNSRMNWSSLYGEQK